MSERLTTLHRTLSTRFSLEELRTLCFELRVPYDDLGGEGRSAKARELIQWMDRRGRLDELDVMVGTLTRASKGPADAALSIGVRPQIEAADRSGTGDRPLVLSIHGIRTRGVWQKRLQPSLDSAGFRHDPLDFDFFRAIRLLWPRARRRQVEWFRDTYFQKIMPKDPLPSIIAHSLGTYLVTEAMRLYEGIAFDRVILCGSIVRADYPWSEVSISARRVARVLNDFGGRDVWARVVAWVIADAGPSGAGGFEDVADGRIVQRGHPDRRHSDYFYEGNFRVWISFLRDESLPAPITAPRRSNRKFRLTLALGILTLLVIGLATYWGLWR